MKISQEVKQAISEMDQHPERYTKTPKKEKPQRQEEQEEQEDSVDEGVRELTMKEGKGVSEKESLKDGEQDEDASPSKKGKVKLTRRSRRG